MRTNAALVLFVFSPRLFRGEHFSTLNVRNLVGAGRHDGGSIPLRCGNWFFPLGCVCARRTHEIEAAAANGHLQWPGGLWVVVGGVDMAARASLGKLGHLVHGCD